MQSPGILEVENTYPLGEVIRDLIRENPGGYRLFGPDETHSNRLQAVYETTKKVWMANFFRKTSTAASSPAMAQ